MLDFSVTFIITIINITVLFLILRAVLWKPVTKFMEERAKKVENAIAQSEEDKARAKELLARYEAQLKTAETEAESIIRTAKEYAQSEADKIIADGRISAGTAIESAQKQIEIDRQAAILKFRKESASLVVEAAGRLLGREIKSEDSRQYAEMLLAEILPAEMLPGEASTLN
jgi:F-type H+-transporting ATPase subunit b